MAINSGIFPRKTYKYFVPNSKVTGSSFISVIFDTDPGAAMGQGTIQFIEKHPGVGFTVHLSSIVFTDSRFTYILSNPGDISSGGNVVSGDLIVDGDLTVYGTEYIHNREIIETDQLITGTLYVSGDMNGYSNLYVTDTIFGETSGQNVNIFFDNTDTTLVSNFVQEAIEELSSKTNSVSAEMIQGDINTLSIANSYTDEASSNLINYINLQDQSILSQSISYTNIVSADLLEKIQNQNELSEILANGNSAGSYQINMNNNKIVNVSTPTLSGDATNKGYIDTQNLAISGNLINYINLQDQLILSQSKTYTNSASAYSYSQSVTYTNTATASLKVYVDSRDQSILSQANSFTNSASAYSYNQSVTYTNTASSNLVNYVNSKTAAQNELSEILANGNDANNIRILNLGAPLSPKDATTKQYVDTLTQNTSGTLKTYIDSQDQSILSQTSAASANVLSQAITYTNSATANLKVYVDNQDQSILSQAKTYTNSATGTLKVYVDTQDFATLSSAKTYTNNATADLRIYVDNQNLLDEKLTNKSTVVSLGASNTLYPTQNAVKTYVDTATGNLKTYVDNRDNNILSQANSFTNSASAYSYSQSVTYTNTATADLKVYVDNRDNNILSQTSAASANVLSQAITYTNTATSSLKTYVDSRDQSILSQANSFTNSASAYSYNQAVAYTNTVSGNLGNSIGSHTSNTSNPHQTTLQQVTTQGATSDKTITLTNAGTGLIISGDLVVRGTTYQINVISINETISGNEIIGGALTVNGNAVLGDTTSDTATINGDTILNKLTASRLMSTDSSKKIASVSAITNWITGANNVAIIDYGNGTATAGVNSGYQIPTTTQVGNIHIQNTDVGTTSGTFYLTNTNTAIYQANVGTFLKSVIAVQLGDTNGHGVYLGSGALTLVGGGESADSFRADTATYSPTSEQLFLASDTSIRFFTNCNTYASRLETMTLSSSGTITLNQVSSGSILSTDINKNIITTYIADTDILLTANSDIRFATQKAVKTYVDSAIGAENFWDRSGTTLTPHTSGDIARIDGIGIGITPVTNKLLCGSTASTVDFPSARSIFSIGDSGCDNADSIGLVAEAPSGRAIYAGIKTNGSTTGTGVTILAKTTAAGDTASVWGIMVDSISTRAGANKGILLNISGSSVQNRAIEITVADTLASGIYIDSTGYSFYGNTGTLYNSGVGQIGGLGIEISPAANKLLVGSNASTTDFPYAKTIFSNGNTGETSSFHIGIVGESYVQSPNYSNVGVYGIAMAYSSAACVAGNFVAKTESTGLTVNSIAGRFFSQDAHSGGNNIAVYADASGSANDYSFYGTNGDIYNNEKLLIGSTASTTDFPNAKSIISQGNSGITGNNYYGLLVEATGGATYSANALGAYSKTNGTLSGNAIYGYTGVAATSNTGQAIAGSFLTIEAHASGDNIAIYASALNSLANNYSFYGNSGVLYNTDDFLTTSSSCFYFGLQTTNGSWRMRVNGNDFVFERRESSVWVEKGKLTAS